MSERMHVKISFLRMIQTYLQYVLIYSLIYF